MPPPAGSPRLPAEPPRGASAAGTLAPAPGWRALVASVPLAWWIAAALIVAVRCVALQMAALPDGEMTGDEPIYDMVARGLLAGHGLLYKGQPWILRPPGWPLLLAGLFALPTPDRPTVVLFQGLCDGVSAFVWAGIALAVFRRRSSAAAAFLAIVIWPPFFRESLFMQTDPIYTALLAVLSAAFLAFVRDVSARRAALVGLVAGVAMMVRPPGLIFLGGLMLGWIAWRPRNLMSHFPALAVTVAVALLVIAPWAIRNERVFHRFVPLSLGSGEQFFEGALLQTDGRFVHGETFAQLGKVVGRETARVGHPLDNFERDHALLEAGLDQWRAAPGHSVVIVLRRFWRLCLVSPNDGDRPVVRYSFLAALLLLYALAVPRMLAAWPAADPVRAFPAVLGAALALSVLGHVPFYTNSRYFEPMRPVLLVLAADAVARRFVRTPAA